MREGRPCEYERLGVAATRPGRKATVLPPGDSCKPGPGTHYRLDLRGRPARRHRLELAEILCAAILPYVPPALSAGRPALSDFRIAKLLETLHPLGVRQIAADLRYFVELDAELGAGIGPPG